MPENSYLETSKPARDAILAALDKVASSDAFAKSARQARFLRHLVETSLRGETHLLKESVLGVDVFDRPAGWDARLDPIVRMEAARLRKRIAKYYETAGSADEVRIELPIGNYVPVFTSHVVARDLESVRTPFRKWNPWYVVAALGCALAGISGARYFRSENSAGFGTPASIAVLPFRNLSADPNNQYFADGLTDEITDLLARNKSLRVVARSSAAQFKTADLAEVGGKLQVANVLEGSVERSGDRIRIIAHLEKVSDGSHLWSNTYERQSSDLFAVQTELAKSIAENLKAGVSPPNKHIPPAEAAEWVMKGRYELQQNTPQSLSRAESDFQHAIDLDPDYAGAYAALAATKYNQAPARLGDHTDGERRESERLARKALSLDPELAGAHVSLAFLAMQYDWDWARAEKELQQALAAAPNASANTTYAFLLTARGRSPEANKYLQQAQDLDPFGTATLSNIAGVRYLQGRNAERRDLARKLLSVAPQMLSAQLMNISGDVEEGHPELAWPKLQELKQRYPVIGMSEAALRARAGERQEALRLMQPFEEKYPATGVPMQSFALVYAYLNDEANTVKWLERSADAREWQALNLGVNPAFKSMEHSAGFRALKKRIGLDL